jgi:hypothetical protein
MHSSIIPRALSAIAILVNLALAAPAAQSTVPPQSTVEWAVVGDSWSAGIAYSSGTKYDSDTSCQRSTEAWGVQMAADNTWTDGPQNFHFAACSGSLLGDIKTSQIQNAGSPQFILTTSGGNNAFFGTIVDSCVYQGVPGKKYGNPYDQDPDGTGQCKIYIQKAKDYVANTASGLSNDLKLTLNDIFNTNQARSHPNFYLYVGLYAQFFNAQTTACNTWSFAPWWRLWKPRLVQALRQELNNGFLGFSNVYVSAL